jgi:hypothetical protein
MGLDLHSHPARSHLLQFLLQFDAGRRSANRAGTDSSEAPPSQYLPKTPNGRETRGPTRELIVDDPGCRVGSMRGPGRGNRASLID